MNSITSAHLNRLPNWRGSLKLLKPGLSTKSAFILCAALSLLAMSCGGNETHSNAPIQHETPADEIMRVGLRWQTAEEIQLMPPQPNPLLSTRQKITSVLQFEPGVKYAVETIHYQEEFKLRGGGAGSCLAETKQKHQLRFGRRLGSAVVELRRPPLRMPRLCTGTRHPEPELSLPAHEARYELRDDQLILTEPTRVERVYLPMP